MKKIVLVLQHAKKLMYGAETSLKEYIVELKKKDKDLQVDLIVRKSIFTKYDANDLKNIRKFFKGTLSNIYFFNLPISYSEIELKYNVKNRISEKVNNFFWFKNKKEFYMKLKKEKYDYIHINNTSLFNIVKKEFPFFLHVRDVIFKMSNNLSNKVKLFRGIFFIDKSTFTPFSEMLDKDKYIIINNPYNALNNLQLNSEKIVKELKIDKDKIIFTLIGRIDPIKGVKKVIKNFLEYKNNKAILLIVGGALDKAYEDECKQLAKADKRIMFLGETNEIEKIYEISDYLIRGEDFFCIGRTHFEALFNGLNIIIPGKEEEFQEYLKTTSDDDFEKFKTKIKLYLGDYKKGLVELLNLGNWDKIKVREKYSNTKNYVLTMTNFIEKGIKNEKNR